jgi:hypothetical protein
MNIIVNFLLATVSMCLSFVAAIMWHAAGGLTMTIINSAIYLFSVAYIVWALRQRHWRFQCFRMGGELKDGFVLLPMALFTFTPNIHMNGIGKFCEHSITLHVGWGVWSVNFSLGYASFDPDKSEFLKRNRFGK